MIGALVAGITGSGGASLNSYESIATVTPSAGTTSVVLNSIPSTFKHLQVRFMMRRNAAGTCQVYIRPNSDSTANKAYHYVRGDGSTVSANGAVSSTRIYIGEATSSTQSTGIFSVGTFDILDYGSTTKTKTIRSFNGYDANGSGWVYVSSGLWNTTTAISSLEIEFAGDATETGATFALYGIKEA